MRRFWWDGVFGESSEIVWFQYLTVYLLFLGAGPGLIGALASLSSLASAVSTLPGAAVAERSGQHKRIVLFSFVGARMVFLLLAVMPWLGGSGVTVAVLVTACLLKGVLSSFALPAWNAIAAEVAPEETRGRYFAFRNFGRQGISMALTPVAGILLAAIGGMAGWQVLWLGSAVLALLAGYCFARLPLPRGVRAPSARAPEQKPGIRDSFREVWRDSMLRRFVGTMSLFQLSVMIAGPFFSVYLVERLGASPFWVGMVATASPLSAMLCQPFLGRVADAIGPRRLLIGANAVILLTPVAWLFAAAPWHVILINLVGGAAWQANQLGSFNFLLAVAPQKRLPTYAAVQQLGMFAVTFVGPLAGGLIIGVAGYQELFLLSALGRLVATGLQYLLLFDEPTSRSSSPAVRPLLATDSRRP